MSTNTKRLLIIMGIAAVFCLVAVAAAIGGASLLVNRFKDSVVTDPAKIQQMAHEFVNYELPPDYEEQMGMDFMVYKMILITSPEPTSKPMIFLAQFQAENSTPEQMAEQMRQSVEQQSGRNGLKLKVVETRNVTINGKETLLTVSEGPDKTGAGFRQWMTACPAKSGMIILLIQGDVDGWDDAALESFLASINT